MIRDPQTERLPLGGADVWDQPQASVVLRDDMFAAGADASSAITGQDSAAQFFGDEAALLVVADGYQQVDFVAERLDSPDAEQFFAFFGEGEYVADVSIDIASDSRIVVADVVVALAQPETFDWFALYDQPEPTDDEWSGPVQAQAPPDQVFADGWDWLDEASDSTFEIAEDADPVGPSVATDGAPADGWPWGDEFSAFDDPTDDSAVVGADLVVVDVRPFFGDDAEHLLEEAGGHVIADGYQQADGAAAPEDFPLQLDWEWAGEVEDVALELAHSDSEAVGPNAAAGAAIIVDSEQWGFDVEVEEFHADDFGNEELDEPGFEAFWDWTEAADDEWDAGTQPVGANAAAPVPAAIEDAWDWFADSHDGLHEIVDADSEPLGADVVVAPSTLPEDTHDWLDAAPDEWDGSSEPVAPDVIEPPVPASDDWPWFDDVGDAVEPDSPLLAPSAPVDSPAEDAWDWHVTVEDDWADWAQQLGADYIPPPSQFTDDGWDWSFGYPTDDGLEVDLWFYERTEPQGGSRVYIRGRTHVQQVTGRKSIHKMNGRRQIVTVTKDSE